MPHSVRDQTITTQGHSGRGDQGQLSPPSSTTVGNSAQQQSPMLTAWSDELDPKNLTITETLFLGGLTSARGDVHNAGGNQGTGAMGLSG